MRPSVNASTASAAIPTRPKAPTMNCVVRLAYIQRLSVRAEFGAVAGGPAGQESIEDFVMSGGHLLGRPIQSHLALMDEAYAIANLEDRGNIVTNHHNG